MHRVNIIEINIDMEKVRKSLHVYFKHAVANLHNQAVTLNWGHCVEKV